jgi:prepilin-type N-terminal cleavage/methylation domain-containing protein
LEQARKQKGFSLIELMFVMAIILILSTFALLQIGNSLRLQPANAALQTTLGQLRRVHEMAVDQRRTYRVTFSTPRTIQVDQVGFDTATPPNRTFTLVSRIDLPPSIQFTVVSGVPTASSKVPDGYGNGTVAIDLDKDFGGGGTDVYFQRDGRALDSSNRVNNGVLYMCRPGDVMSCKAVSLWGYSGRVKGWNLVKNNGVAEWRP